MWTLANLPPNAVQLYSNVCGAIVFRYSHCACVWCVLSAFICGSHV